MRPVLFLFLAASFAACENSGSGNSINTRAAQPASKASAPVFNTTPVQAQPSAQPGVTVQPGAVTAQPQPANVQAATPSEAAGANPAHGQPGHRCDIPVGAPLNSPAAAAPTMPQAASVINSAPQIVNQPSAPVVTPVAGQKVNPPHGQPGHDCTIPVGQPLKQ